RQDGHVRADSDLVVCQRLRHAPARLHAEVGAPLEVLGPALVVVQPTLGVELAVVLLGVEPLHGVEVRRAEGVVAVSQRAGDPLLKAARQQNSLGNSLAAAQTESNTM